MPSTSTLSDTHTTSSIEFVPAEPALPDSVSLLSQFSGLSCLHRQAISSLTDTLDSISNAQRNSLEVSGKCQQLADSIVRHNRHSQEVLREFDMIEHEGEHIRMRDVSSQAERIVGDIANDIMTMARDIMQMVFRVHDVNDMMHNTRKTVQTLQGISWQSRMLTLSAKAVEKNWNEDTDSGERLALALEAMSQEMGQTVDALDANLVCMEASLAEHAEKLAAVAAIDIDEYVTARAYIGSLNAKMQSHVSKNRNMLDMLQQTIANQQASIERLNDQQDASVSNTTMEKMHQIIVMMTAMADLGGTLEYKCRQTVPQLQPTSTMELLDRANLPIELRQKLAELLVDNSTPDYMRNSTNGANSSPRITPISAV